MENLKIYIDRLKGGVSHKVDETLTPDFLEVDDEELLFDDPVHIQGEVYLAEEHLVIHLNIDTSVYLPCSICNDAVSLPVAIKNIYLTVPLSEIKGAVFDLKEEIRECILLQVPLFAECNAGKCPDRENLKKFLRTNDDAHFPFADLD
jgi:uncharacterized metal-binding protein YceD (DUF177 family)